MDSFSIKFLKKCRFVILLLILLLIFYFHPTKEVMTCDKNYQCSVEHEFINFIKFKNTFKLNHSSMIYMKRVIHGYRHRYRTINVEFDNIKPFIVDFYDNDFNDYEVRNDFYKYRDNPERTYFLEGFANSVELYLWVLVFIFLCISFKDLIFSKN